MFKKLFVLALVLGLLAMPALAGDELSAFMKATPTDATSIDLGARKVTDLDAFSDWLATLPALTKCDMVEAQGRGHGRAADALSEGALWLDDQAV